MNKTFQSLIILLTSTIFLLSFPAVAQNGGMRYSITVVEFENQSGWTGQFDLGTAWATVLTDLLNRSDHFFVLGDSSMRKAALDEQDLATAGRTAQGAKAPDTGQMTPAQLLVKGAITHVQHDTKGGGGGLKVGKFRLGGKKNVAEMNVTIYLTDSTTGEVVASNSVVGLSKSRGFSVGYTDGDAAASFGGHKDDNLGLAITNAAGLAVQWLVEQLPKVSWHGNVVLVRDGEVYINRGAREGITPGQNFVVGKPDVIRDPATGEVLHRSLEEVARIQATKVVEKLSICTVLSGDVMAVHKGLGVSLP